MSSSLWAGGNVLTWGDGRSQSVDTWGSALDALGIPVVDPPTPLADLSISLKNNPMKVWKEQASLRKVVDFAAEQVASVPLHVYLRESDTDRKRDATGRAEQLLAKPGAFLSGPALLHDIVVDWMLYDRWLVILVDDELVRIPPGLINLTHDFLGRVEQIMVKSPLGLVDVSDLPLAFDSGWSGDKAGGISPLHTLATTLEEQRRAVQWRSEQWRNAARVSGILMSEKTMNPVVRDRILESWRDYRQSKAGGTPFLENDVKFLETKEARPVDTQDLEGRKLTDAEVASFYHIPPELVGARAGTFSNIAAFRQMLFGPTLGPRLTRIEAAFNASIIPALAPANAYAEFNREAAMAGSFSEQAEVLSRSTGGPWLTRNEARGRQNLPAIEGADELVVPKNVTEGGLGSPADTSPTDNPPAWGV